MDEIEPRLGWPHLLMLLPGGGAALTLFLALGREDPTEKAELRQAARWQGGAFGVLLVHGMLQMGIWFVAWLFGSMPPEILDQTPAYKHLPLLLSLCTHGNITAGAAEWLILAWFAVKASRGQPYPARGKDKI